MTSQMDTHTKEHGKFQISIWKCTCIHLHNFEKKKEENKNRKKNFLPNSNGAYAGFKTRKAFLHWAEINI